LEAWYDRVTGLYLVGRVDACLRTAEFLHVPVDHKCRGSSPVEVNESYALQLDVYDLLLEKNGYPTAGYGFLDYYIISGDVESGMASEGISLSVEVHRLKTDSGRALEWLLRAKYVLDGDRAPEPSPDCEFCDWARLVSQN
jgi:hypothetical protein